MVFLDQPFQVGDLIRSTNQEIEGTVEKIGWRLTQIRTLNKSLIFVPNALFSTIIVENASQMNGRKIQTKLILSYTDTVKAHQIISGISDHLKNDPQIDQTAPYFANLINFSPFGLEISVQAYTKTTDTLKYQEIQQDLFFNILNIIKSHDAHLYRSFSRNRFLTGFTPLPQRKKGSLPSQII
jgi:MscS family membrane protein